MGVDTTIDENESNLFSRASGAGVRVLSIDAESVITQINLT